MARMPDCWVARLAVAGTPAEARAGLDGLRAAGVTDTVLAPVGPIRWEPSIHWRPFSTHEYRLSPAGVATITAAPCDRWHSPIERDALSAVSDCFSL
ncbi:hypothetical protein ACIBQ3_12490 [Streptomyces rubiginosohelvolus]|uniref:hypothetical protein n=1 Tax=Streptomyces rubiginosohelvolus TaxID=67362 RepID=UPI0037952C36